MARPTIEQLQDVRKCPLHNAYIQSYRANHLPGRPRQRYCPVCETERMVEDMQKKKADEAAGIIQPKLIIRKY